MTTTVGHSILRNLSLLCLRLIKALNDKLQALFSAHESNTTTIASSGHVDHLVHVHFKLHDYFVEYTPLLVTYAVLFMYIYFSVRKYCITSVCIRAYM